MEVLRYRAEVELAYIEMLSTFGAAFFERYNALRPIDPGYFEARRDIYQLYPLLVHTENGIERVHAGDVSLRVTP